MCFPLSSTLQPIRSSLNLLQGVLRGLPQSWKTSRYDRALGLVHPSPFAVVKTAFSGPQISSSKNMLSQ